MTTAPHQATPVRATRRCLGAIILLLAVGPIGTAQAQDSYTRALIEQVERLQQDFASLQRRVYQGGAVAGGDEGSLSPTQATRLELRMGQFEDALRRLTGNAEELTYRMSQLSSQLDEVVAGLTGRLDRLEAGGPAFSQVAPATSQPSQGLTTASTAPAQALPQAAQTTPGNTALAPQTLGTVAAADLEALRSQALKLQQGGATTGQGATQVNLQTKTLPGNTSKEKYDYAFGLLSQANYPAAETALQSFLQQHPGDPLAGNAKYWLGETYYVRQLYKEAAVTFAEGFQQYPASTKAPDNLLKLGKSLAALGQTEDACGTQSELLRRFPNAPATILQQAASERQRLACP